MIASMKTYTSHPFQSNNDLLDVGKLIRRSYACSKSLNAWSVARFDIWAQRRMDDAATHGETSWRKYFRVWRDEFGMPAGAAFAFDNHRTRKNPNPFALVFRPDHLQLAETMLDWAESLAAPEVEIRESNTFLLEIALKRGYLRSDDFMVVREKALSGTATEAVDLPAGYHIAVLKYAEWAAYFVAVNAVFNMMDSVDAFRSILRAPSSVPELHLNVLGETGEIAAFCSVWLDRENNVAEFEPVGTVPHYQKKGLASALLAHACNRLREMACPLVKVESWSESMGANKLYTNSGLLETDCIYTWKIH
jgi:GNAT superfamily N-acetyltransferase